MINRKILYGYQIRDGRITIQDDEAVIVNQMFTLYRAGLSYQKIADTLNHDGIPFSQEAPAWNKHKVKRLLENPRYTGTDGYPVLVDQDAFQAVQQSIQEKTSGYTTKEQSPVTAMKKALHCQKCGGQLLGMGGKGQEKDTLYLKCAACGERIAIKINDLLAEVSRQAMEYRMPTVKAYQPSEKVIRLTNAINRGLENPESPQEIVSLILRGTAARYDCCPAPQYNCPDRLSPVDWNCIRQAVSHITISAENVVTVAFR